MVVAQECGRLAVNARFGFIEELKGTLLLIQQFFSFDNNHTHRAVHSITSVKYESVYHSLQVHAMEDISLTLSQHPLKQPKKLKG
jgi:hypothetical protein